jgi:hypothetical protein
MHQPGRGATRRPYVFSAMSMQPLPRFGLRRRSNRSLLLVATALLLGAVAACGDGPGGPEAAAQPPSAPEPIGPRGAVSLPVSFTWKQVPGDWIYRLTVTDEAERLMYQQDIRNGSSLPMTREIAAMMNEQHATFLWSVAIVTPDGRHLADSPHVPFSLK